MNTSIAGTTRAALAQPTDNQPPPTFDPATVDDLPAPAKRLLNRALPPDTPLNSLVELTMEGKIKLGGRWLPFTADQILRAGVGFVWAPTVGNRILRFTGADTLGPNGAHIEFRFLDRIPVVRGSGPDIDRSAAGRLAAETVAWLPQALTPQAGAHWTAIDDERATVTPTTVEGRQIPVEVAVDRDGQLTWLALERWRDSAKPPGLAPFGGSVTKPYTTDTGVVIAGSGVVGWDWDTCQQADGEFFRYTVTSARFPDPTVANPPVD
ncbi:MAG: DUF6544 family protein [Acidimicrobiales bacterium]